MFKQTPQVQSYKQVTATPNKSVQLFKGTQFCKRSVQDKRSKQWAASSNV